MGQSLSRFELDQLAKESLSPQDEALLTSAERAYIAKVKSGTASNATQGEGGASGPIFGTAKDLGVGFAKQMGERFFDLGKVVHSIPGLGDLTDQVAKLVGPPGTYPDAAFKGTARDINPTLAPKGAAQELGGSAERLAEFVVPANPSRLAAVKGLVKLIPNSASPAAMKVLNKGAALAGRTIGEAGSASAVSALQGDETPELAGAVAGTSPIVGEGLNLTTQALLKNPFLSQKLLPLLVGALTVQATGSMSGGLGAGMGTYGVARGAAAKAIKSPAFKRKLGGTIQKGTTWGGRVGAAISDDLRPGKKRLKEAEDY